MRKVVADPEAGNELLKSLELAKLRKDVPDGHSQDLSDMHRSFHFHVVGWLQKHGFDTLNR